MAAAAIAIAGTAISVYGQYMQSQEEAKAARLYADMREAEAKEIQERSRENEKAIRSESRQFEAYQVSSFASGGVDVGSGSPLLAMESASASFRREIESMYREANFRSQQLRAEAGNLREQASSIKRAGLIGAGGRTLLTAGQLYSNSGGSNSYNRS